MNPRFCGKVGMVLKWRKLCLEFIARDVYCWNYTGLITTSAIFSMRIQS